MHTFRDRFNKCKKVISKVDKANCLFILLHDISDLQDSIQIEIPKINQSVNYSKSLTNSANALLLEASRWKGDIRPQLTVGYDRKHIDNIIRTYNNMSKDLGLASGTVHDKLVCTHISEDAPLEKNQKLHNLLFVDQEKLAPLF